MKTIGVRRGFYERFTQRDQRVVSLSRGRGVLVVDPGGLAVVCADDMAEGSVYVKDLTVYRAVTIYAGVANLSSEGLLTPTDLRRIARLAAGHLRVYRYAVDCREYGYGGGMAPEPTVPLARSLEGAKALLAEFGRETGTDDGYVESGEWVSRSHAWVYASAAWDGISFGDPLGVLEFGPRGGLRFEPA